MQEERSEPDEWLSTPGLDLEELEEFCRDALKECIDQEWRQDEEVFDRIGSLLSQCLAKSASYPYGQPYHVFPFGEISPSVLEKLLAIAAGKSSRNWVSAAIEVDSLLWSTSILVNSRTMDGGILSHAWRMKADFASLSDMCAAVILGYPDLLGALEDYAVTGDVRRLSWFLEPGTELPREVSDERLEGLIRVALANHPFDATLWRAMCRIAASRSTLELAAELVLPVVDERSPKQGVLAGSPAEAALREILESGTADSIGVGWAFVKKGLTASGAATRGAAADVLASWDQSEWPDDATIVVQDVLERETDQAVIRKLDLLVRK